MKTFLRSLVVAALVGGGAASAQIHVDIGLPSIHFAVQPPLVTVQAGVQVVPEQEEEVFYSDGYYWTRRETHWYRCQRDWRWEPVEVRYVPVRVARIPPGHYKHWHKHHDDDRVVPVVGRPVYRSDDRDWDRDHDHDQDRDHDRDDRDDDHDDDHGPGRGHGNGHGHGHGHH